MAKPKNVDRKLPNVIRIYCEGAKTEPQYLNGFVDSLPDSRYRFVVEVAPTRKNTPVQLVDEAVAHKKSSKYVEGDLLWVVYDREGTAKYSNELHSKAYNKAKQNGIGVAISNVCFEFWLLLHLIDTTAPHASYDELCKSSNFKKLYKEATGHEYEKAGVKIFQSLKDRLPDARKRAIKIIESSFEQAEEGKFLPFHLNPYTNIHELLAEIETLKGAKTKRERDRV